VAEKLSRKKVTILLVLLGLLLAFNVFAFSYRFFHEESLILEWRKGPLIHRSFPYSTTNAAIIFWPVAAGMADALALVALFWFVYRRRFAASTRRNMLDMGVSTAALLLTLAGGEVTTRVTIHTHYFNQYRPDPDLNWFNRPLLRDHVDETDRMPKSTNSLGFRGAPEVPAEKQDDEIRIMVVGDSTAFGYGVPDQNTFSQVIEKTLRDKTGKNVTVVNTASPGHTSHQGLRILDRHGELIRPDLLVWSYNNDPCLDVGRDKDRLPDQQTALAIKRQLFKSDLYLIFRRVVLDLMYGWRLEQYQSEMPQEQNGWVKRVPFEDYQEFLEEFHDRLQERGGDVVYLRMPMQRSMVEKRPIYKSSFDDRYRDYLLEFCRQKKGHCIDFEKKFNDIGDIDLFIPGHLFHPSSYGHYLVGTGVADYIIEQGLLSGSGQ